MLRQIIPQVAEELAKTYSLGRAKKKIIKQGMSRSLGVKTIFFAKRGKSQRL